MNLLIKNAPLSFNIQVYFYLMQIPLKWNCLIKVKVIITSKCSCVKFKFFMSTHWLNPYGRARLLFYFNRMQLVLADRQTFRE
jgi:hypothetical protein